jgi:hypothetical protein
MVSSDLVTLVDRIMAAPKRIAGADVPPKWGDVWYGREPQAKLPLEVDGEIGIAQLLVVGLPNAPGLQFRLGILMSGCVCRLDYTDETHANSFAIAEDGLPPIVRGPHYHSWQRNRRFFRGLTTAPQLHNAEPFIIGPSFDSTLRWFCAETNIQSLPSTHRIQLPLRDRLL